MFSGVNRVALALLTWTEQPSHVRLCLRVPCVLSDWSTAAVTRALHNLHVSVNALAAADTREAPDDPLTEHCTRVGGACRLSINGV